VALLVAPAVLAFKGGAGGQAVFPAAHHVGQVVGVKELLPAPVAQLLKADPHKIEPPLVVVVDAAIGLGRPGHLGQRFEQLLKAGLAGQHLLLQHALLMHVGVGAVPSHYLAAGRAAGLRLPQKPTILLIVAPQPELELVVALVGNGRRPPLLHQGAVVGMHKVQPVGRAVLLHRFAHVRRHAVVVEVHGAVGAGRPHLLRQAFGLNAQLLLASHQLLLQLAQLGYIGVGAKPAQHRAAGIADGPRAAQKPAVLPIVPPQRESVFPGLPSLNGGEVALIHASHQGGLVHAHPAPALHFGQC